jgi:alpha-L-arabinofuranosidase
MSARRAKPEPQKTLDLIPGFNFEMDSNEEGTRKYMNLKPFPMKKHQAGHAGISRKSLFLSQLFIFWILGCCVILNAQETILFKHTTSPDPSRARLKVDLSVRSPYPVTPLLFSKFTEHLGQNIYNGIDAQILMNPTMEKWHFSAGDSQIDGGFKEETDFEKISSQWAEHSHWMGFPTGRALLEDYKDGAAFGWMRQGPKENVLLSPDVGPAGGRAQRVEILKNSAGQHFGLFQSTYLPTHRTQKFQFRAVVRAVKPATIRIAIAALDGPGKLGRILAAQDLTLGIQWATLQGTLEIPAGFSLASDSRYAFCITSGELANWVVDRVLLYPSDHINYADPDVVRFYRDARLPLMRWPGGNFVSGYHWRDGIGPVDQRPTLPNPAWGALEYNLFGTDEFIALCRTIGCAPMICVNAGNGTPEEAASWVEYCNGSKDTPMGQLRASQGHPEPYGVKYWEIGNEVFGRWQISWTTPGGYVDRYKRFTAAMKAADPTIQFLACGEKTYQDNSWNLALVAAAGSDVRIVTDHVLTGGPVDAQTDPMELFHAFMGYQGQLDREYRDLRQRMLDAGIKNPRLAITELQLFSYYTGKAPAKGEAALSPRTMPVPQTISEALYDATMINACIRLGDFVEMFTHSATVNHGGGLEKRKERVWANPCYYGRWMGRDLAGGIPVRVELSSGTYSTQHQFGLIVPMKDVPLLDAMAVVSADEATLTVMLVHRGGAAEPITLDLDPGQFQANPEVKVLTLAGKTMYDRNTLDEPEKIKPQPSMLKLETGKGRIILRPFSLTRLTFQKSVR